MDTKNNKPSVPHLDEKLIKNHETYGNEILNIKETIAKNKEVIEKNRKILGNFKKRPVN
ncbi:hypothetical protein R4Z10_09070 [Niallia sp. XMNu-256]|uniref:hypothetical protein n=1 Tax=Niallia sp. XMNu-256 TaxID=3082444 RepID=UPI0030CBA3DE